MSIIIDDINYYTSDRNPFTISNTNINALILPKSISKKLSIKYRKGWELSNNWHEYNPNNYYIKYKFNDTVYNKDREILYKYIERLKRFSRNYVNSIINLKLLRRNISDINFRVNRETSLYLPKELVNIIIEKLEDSIIGSKIYQGYLKMLPLINCKINKNIIFTPSVGVKYVLPCNYDNLSFLNHYKKYIDELMIYSEIPKKSYLKVKYKIDPPLLDYPKYEQCDNLRKFNKEIKKKNKNYGHGNRKGRKRYR